MKYSFEKQNYFTIYLSCCQAPRSRFRRLISNPFVAGHGLFTLTLAGSAMAAGLLLARGLISAPWIMAPILSTTSLGVVVPVLTERGLTRDRLGAFLAGVLHALDGGVEHVSRLRPEPVEGGAGRRVKLLSEEAHPLRRDRLA